MIDHVYIERVEDELAIADVFFQLDGHPKDGFTREQAIDIAEQIVDDWNFSCDELEGVPVANPRPGVD